MGTRKKEEGEEERGGSKKCAHCLKTADFHFAYEADGSPALDSRRAHHWVYLCLDHYEATRRKSAAEIAFERRMEADRKRVAR